jgi:protein farnesyltransferase subunit beta
MLGIKTSEVTEGVAAFLERCQTYEGGIGGEPGAEAHGGYAFCGLATHVLLDCNSRLDLRRLLVRRRPLLSPIRKCPPQPHTCG